MAGLITEVAVPKTEMAIPTFLRLTVLGRPFLRLTVLGRPFLRLTVLGRPFLRLTVLGRPFLCLRFLGRPFLHLGSWGTAASPSHGFGTAASPSVYFCWYKLRPGGSLFLGPLDQRVVAEGPVELKLPKSGRFGSKGVLRKHVKTR